MISIISVSLFFAILRIIPCSKDGDLLEAAFAVVDCLLYSWDIVAKLTNLSDYLIAVIQDSLSDRFSEATCR